MIFFIATICSAFAVLAWKRLDWALLVIIASLPAYLIRFELIGLPLTVLEAFILIVSGVWILKYFWPANRQLFQFKLTRDKHRLDYPYGKEALALIIISFIAAGVSGFTPGSLGIWKAYFFEPVLLFLIIINVFQGKNEYLKILTALALSAGGVSLLALYQNITGDLIANPFWAATETRRVVSFFGYPNAVGLFLAPISLILVGWLLSYKKGTPLSKKIILSLVIIAAWGAIYFAKSDGAMIAVAAGLGIIALLYSSKSRLVILIFIGLSLISIPLFQLKNNSIAEKLSLRDLSGEIRRQQWRETWRMLSDGRLIMGAGLDNYQETIKPYHQEGIFYNFDKRDNFDAVVWANPELQKIYWQPVEIYLYPHNIILNFWSELGLLGMVIFFWLLIRAIYATYLSSKRAGPDKQEKFIPLGILASFSAIIIHGLVDVPYFKNDLSVLFWIILAISSLLELSNKRPAEELSTKI